MELNLGWLLLPLFFGVIMDWIGSALTLANGVIDQIPDYDDRQRNKFKTLYRMHQEETKKLEDNRDHDLIAWLEDDLKPYVTRAVSFAQEKNK